MGDESNALAFVIHNPTSLSYSLEKRLKPRLEEAKEAGMIIYSTCLNSIMVRTDLQWDKKIAKQQRVDGKSCK